MPRAGFDWDAECTHTFVKRCGWVKIDDAEGSCFTKRGCLATVYIDDIVIGGPRHLVEKVMNELEQYLDMKWQRGLDKVVGINFISEIIMTQERIAVRFVYLNMTAYAHAWIAEYKQLAGIAPHQALKSEDCPEFPKGYAALDKYREVKGRLEEHSRRLIGKGLYLARAARPDILHGVCVMARLVTTWRAAADMMMHKLICYLASTAGYELRWQFFYPTHEGLLQIYGQSDSGHAGEYRTMKSTSGHCVWLQDFAPMDTDTPSTYALTDWACEKHDRNSSSSSESEMVAAHALITKRLIPMATTFEQVRGAEYRITHDIDNDACRLAITNGISPIMKYLRMHREVGPAATKDLVEDNGIRLRRIESARNTSDVLTKPLKSEEFVKHRRGLGVILKKARAKLAMKRLASS